VTGRWCPVCDGAKSPSEEVCIGCGITAKLQASDRRDPAKPCPYCGATRADHTAEEAAYCTRQAQATARAAESTTATLEGTP
jgi:phage terminase large subunit GpA-like protein